MQKLNKIITFLYTNFFFKLFHQTVRAESSSNLDPISQNPDFNFSQVTQTNFIGSCKEFVPVFNEIETDEDCLMEEEFEDEEEYEEYEEEEELTLNFGKVSQVKDGIVTITSLPDIKAGEIVYILGSQNDSVMRALILNLNENNSQGILLGSERFVFEGALVVGSSKLFKLSCSLALFGQVLDGLGENKVETGLNNFDSNALVEQKATGIIDREPVRIPLCTGIKAIDSLVPIGRGQRELIIGDRQTGKTSVGLDIILNHVRLNEQFCFGSNSSNINNLRKIVWFVYNAIGQKQSTVNQVKATLSKYKATWFTSIIAATAAESAPLQFLAPYTACTLGEYIRDVVGGHCTVIFDDLSKHAVAYRQMSLLLRRPPGREAFPGDVFYVHSRLLERAGSLTKTAMQVRGTLTAFPVIETQAGDVSAYIPTNVISITDGQIFLETELFYRGIRPAVNVGLSVSRVGSAAQPGIMKKIAGSLKMELAQYREIEGFSKLGASLDEQTQRLLTRGENLIEILKQNLHMPLSTLEQVFCIYLGVGYNGSWLSDMQKQLKIVNLKGVVFSKKRIQLSWLEWIRLLSVEFQVMQVVPLLASLLNFLKRLGLVSLNNNIVAEMSLVKQLKIFPAVFFDDVLFAFVSEFSILNSSSLRFNTNNSSYLYSLVYYAKVSTNKSNLLLSQFLKPEIKHIERSPRDTFFIFLRKTILSFSFAGLLCCKVILNAVSLVFKNGIKKIHKTGNESVRFLQKSCLEEGFVKNVDLEPGFFSKVKQYETLSILYLIAFGFFANVTFNIVKN